MHFNLHLVCIISFALLAVGRRHHSGSHTKKGGSSIATSSQDASATAVANTPAYDKSKETSLNTTTGLNATLPDVGNDTTSSGTGTSGLTSDFGDNGLPAGAPGIPTNIAKVTAYDASAPPFPTSYSEADKTSQAQAGAQLLSTLDNIFQQHLNTTGSPAQGSYTVKPGVYRINDSINIPNVDNFQLIMSDVELIVTSPNAHMIINDANDFEIAGPLYLDADPIPESQAVIVGSDGSSYVDVQVMDGYPMPFLSSRLKCFSTDGVMQRHYQDAITSVDEQSKGVYRVKTKGGSATFDNFPCLSTTGNYFTSQYNNTAGSGGITFRNSGDLNLHQIYHYYSGLSFGGGIEGTLKLDQWMGQRRPGTNRLGAGGWILASFNGGSLDMTTSEISHNYDDLTDINGILGSAMAGPAPNQVYLRSTYIMVGRTFKFYDMSNVELIGTATIKSIDKQNDGSVMSDFNAKESAAQAGTNDGSNPISLVTLDSPISGQSGLYLAEDQQARPKLFSIRDSYLHDGLSEGIQLKGAEQIVATGNVIERTSFGCLTSGFSAFWLEGGAPSNIDYSNNYCIDVPYAVGAPTAAIKIVMDDYQMEHATNTAVIPNVTIADNTIINPQLAGIEVTLSDGVVVQGNKIYNPASVRPTGRDPYGISFQTSQNIVVRDNVVYNTNATSGFNSTTLLVANNRTNTDAVKASGNPVRSSESNATAGTSSNSIAHLDTTDY